MSKLEWYFIGIINLAALEYVSNRPEADNLHARTFWRWHHSKQHDTWIGHADGPNRHPGGWAAWMAEFLWKDLCVLF